MKKLKKLLAADTQKKKIQGKRFAWGFEVVKLRQKVRRGLNH